MMNTHVEEEKLMNQSELLLEEKILSSGHPQVYEVPITVAIIPAYNEERFISGVVFETRRYATHVIVVDDGSTDHTPDLAEAAGAIVVRQIQNGGKAKALNAGFRAAKHFNPEVLICLDGDAQHNPSEIPDLIKPILAKQADVVIGSRFLSIKSKIPKWRQAGQHSLTAVTNTLSGVHTTDSQSGFRAFSTTAMQALKFKTSGLSLESEMQFLFAGSGLRVAEVPISVRYTDGNKRNPVVHGLQVLDAMLSLVSQRRPLLFLSVPGIFISLIGVLLGLRVTFIMKQTGDLLPGTTMLTVLTIVVGLLLAISGVLLHSFGRFMREIREELKALTPSEKNSSFL